MTYWHPLLESWPHCCVPGSRKPYPSSVCEWLRRTAWLCFSLYLTARSPLLPPLWDTSVACASPSLLAQMGNHSHFAYSSFCESLKWCIDFLYREIYIALKEKAKPNTNTFCLSGRTNSFIFTLSDAYYSWCYSLCSELMRRWQVREDSLTDFSNPQFSCPVRWWESNHMFLPKPMPPNLQRKSYLPPQEFAREGLPFHY